MVASIIFYSMSFLLFTMFLKVGAFIISTFVKALEGIIAVVIFGFLMAVLNDPTGMGVFFRDILKIFYT